MKNIKPFTIIPCHEHGFKNNYVLCSRCRALRQEVIKLLGLKIE